MSMWLWFCLGLGVGAVPSLMAETRVRPWWARRWWWISFGIVLFYALPFGIVLIMLLSEAAFDSIQEMGQLLWNSEIGVVTRIALGLLRGSGVMAWAHRKAPRLQGPSPSEQVMALALDPDQHWQAIPMYQQETGAGLAVASDVVEDALADRMRSPQPGDRQRGELSALQWMYLGVAAAWYTVLAVGYALTFGSQTNHFITGLAFFVFIPGLFGGLCGVCGGVITARAKAALQTAFQEGALTRRYAFVAGVVSGAVSIAGVAAVSYTASFSHDETGLALMLVGVGVVLTVSPFLGLWLLMRRAAFNREIRANP